MNSEYKIEKRVIVTLRQHCHFFRQPSRFSEEKGLYFLAWSL